MAFRKTHSVAVLAVLLLGGCSFADDALFPSLSPDSSGSSPASVQASQPILGTSSFVAPHVTPGQPTGTFVGQKVVNLRNDLTQLQTTLSSQNDQLQQLRGQVIQDSQTYHGTVAAIQTRLQVGTTPGNPILVQQWNEAQSEMDRINEDVLRLNRLSSDVASTSGMAAYLLDSVRAARSLSGAVDEDHRQLRVLEDETNTTTVTIERLLNELSSDVQRQQAYVSSERNNLNTLAVAIKNGQLYGTSLANTRLGSSMAPVGPVTAAPSAAPALGNDRPLVVIRFDRPNVNYEDALYTAVRSALDRRPNAVFEVVAVSSSSGSVGGAAIGEASSRRNADSVVRSLTQMGLPNDRIRLSAGSSATARDRKSVV